MTYSLAYPNILTIMVDLNQEFIDILVLHSFAYCYSSN